MTDTPIFLDIANEITQNINAHFIKFLGFGAYKETFLINLDNNQVALKVFNPNKCNFERNKREIDSMKKCNIDNIAKLLKYDTYTNSSNKYEYILEEYLDGGNFTDKHATAVPSPKLLKNYMLHMCTAIQHMKEKNIVHRDIKPDNIMFKKDSDIPIIVDFGLVRDLSECSLTATYLPKGPGTPYYSSPEQLNNEKQLIDWRSDQFSLAIVIGLYLNNYQHPFQEKAETPIDAVYRIEQRQNYTHSFSDSVKKANFHVLLKMLQPWPVLRYCNCSKLINDIKLIGD